MDRYIKEIACLCFLGVAGHACDVLAVTNLLQTVFHHRVQTSSQGKQDFFELGKLILSFSQEPIIDLRAASQQEEKGVRTLTFFFPATEVQGPECVQTLKNIQAQQSPFYSIGFSNAEKPSPGLTFTIKYDQDKVGCTYTVLEAAGSGRRLIFTFYNKTMVKKVDDAHATILRTVANTSRQGVIIDCGHGGDDLGAVGCNGLQEKDVNLEIGMQLATLLRKQGLDVFLTRTTDVFVALDERTLIHDDNSGASILVSIHANAAPNSTASGLETFFFDVTRACTGDDKRTKTTASIMQDRCTESQLLARCIHASILDHVRQKHYVVDRQVKSSFLQVLAGAAVPAALVELGFLTNAQEAACMKDKNYRALLALGVCEGIVKYFQQRQLS